MFCSFIKILSNILADKEIPVPSIDLQPTFVLPPKPINREYGEMSPYIRNYYSLNFSIDYHFDETTNTFETIHHNFDFMKKPKIVLKRFVSRSADIPEEYLSRKPKEISLPTEETSKGIFRLFVGKGVHVGDKELFLLNEGCQNVSLHTHYDDMMKDGNLNLTIYEHILNLFEMTEGYVHTIYAFQFFVSIYKYGRRENEDPFVTISTNMFRLDFSENYSEIKCLTVKEDDFFTEEDQQDLERGDLRNNLEDTELINIAEGEAKLYDEIENYLGMKLSLEHRKNVGQVSSNLLHSVEDDNKGAENTNPQTGSISC